MAASLANNLNKRPQLNKENQDLVLCSLFAVLQSTTRKFFPLEIEAESELRPFGLI